MKDCGAQYVRSSDQDAPDDFGDERHCKSALQIRDDNLQTVEPDPFDDLWAMLLRHGGALPRAGVVEDPED
jgi:hypothetical protein